MCGNIIDARLFRVATSSSALSPASALLHLLPLRNPLPSVFPLSASKHEPEAQFHPGATTPEAIVGPEMVNVVCGVAEASEPSRMCAGEVCVRVVPYGVCPIYWCPFVGSRTRHHHAIMIDHS